MSDPVETAQPLTERQALQAIIDLPTVVPDHPHGNVHPPYLEWVRVAAIARAALATPPQPTVDLLRASDRTMAEYSDTRSACPACGEWRDSPTADCAACGLAHP